MTIKEMVKKTGCNMPPAGGGVEDLPAPIRLVCISDTSKSGVFFKKGQVVVTECIGRGTDRSELFHLKEESVWPFLRDFKIA